MIKKTVSAIFLVLAGLFIAGSISAMVRIALFVFEADATTGVVVGYENVQEKPGDPPQYFALIQYERNGIPQTAFNSQVSRTQDYGEGEELPIYAVNGIPDRVLIRGVGEMVGAPLLSLGLGLLCAMFSAFIYRKTVLVRPVGSSESEPTRLEKSLLRVANFFRPSTLLLMVVFGPILLIVHTVIFVAELFFPSFRKAKREREKFVSDLERLGYFKYLKNRSALPTFKEIITRSHDLFTNDYRRISFTLRSNEMACDEVLRVQNWLRDKGIVVEINSRASNVGEVALKSDEVSRIESALAFCATREERLLVITRLINEALAAAREPGRFYIQYPFTSSIVFLSDELYKAISGASAFPKYLLPLDVMRTSLSDVDAIAKEQNHQNAWHKERLYKVRCAPNGSMEEIDIRRSLQALLLKHNLCVMSVTKVDNKIVLLECGSGKDAAEAGGPLVLLLAMTNDIYEIHDEIPDIDKFFDVDREKLIVLPSGLKVSPSGKICFRQSASTVCVYDIPHHRTSYPLPVYMFRDYVELSLDGEILLYSFTTDDDGLLRIGVYNCGDKSINEYSHQRLVEGGLSGLKWVQSPNVFSIQQRAGSGRRMSFRIPEMSKERLVLESDDELEQKTEIA